MVTQVLVAFGGPVNAAEARETSLYSLTTREARRGGRPPRPGDRAALGGLRRGERHGHPRAERPFASSQRVELRIGGGAPTTLEGSPGRHNAGHDKGRVVKSAIVLTSRRMSRARPCPWGRPESGRRRAGDGRRPAQADELVGLTTSLRAKRSVCRATSRVIVRPAGVGRRAPPAPGRELSDGLGVYERIGLKIPDSI